jgi:hypothetical protein
MPYRQNCVRGNDPCEVQKAPYPSYSPDLAIADFYLFGVLKEKLQGIDVSDDNELKSGIMTIFQGFHRASWKSHSITGSKDASRLSQMQGTMIHHCHKT